MDARDHGPSTHVLCFVVGTDEGLQELVAAQAAVAMALQEVVELSLGIVHVQLVVGFLVLLIFVLVTFVVVEVFDVLLVWAGSRIFGAFFRCSFVVLCLIVDDLLVFKSLLVLLRIFRVFILLYVWPELGVGELFGRDLGHRTVLTSFHLLFELFKLLLALIGLLLFLSLSLLGFFEVNLQLIAEVVREFKFVDLSLFCILLHHLEVVQEEASLRKLDVSTKSTRQAKTDLL